MPLIEIESVLKRLTENRVNFVIIGGVATTLQGLAHTTFDLDICYEGLIRSKKALRRKKDLPVLAELEALLEMRKRA